MVHDRNAGQDTNDCSNPSPKPDSQLKDMIRHGMHNNGVKRKRKQIVLAYNRVATTCRSSKVQASKCKN
jgi:hypothetical protein